MNTSKTIVFFGTESFSLTALQALVDAGFNIAAVVTKPDTYRGRKQVLTAPAVKTYALEHTIPVFQPEKLRDITDNLKKFDQAAGVLVSYGKIIPQSTIDLFSPGIINLHPSLLPKYRGPSPIESAIASGDTETGISIMELSAAMDAGPIYYQETVALGGTETQTSLYEALGELGAKRLIEKLPSIFDGSLLPTPQDDAMASYCQLLTKDTSFVDPTHLTAAAFERHVRAYQEFPRTRIIWHDYTLIITKAHVTEAQNTPLDIECRDGAFLTIDELIAPSGKTMSAAAFLNGYAAG